ncbi:YhcN/YlaJ family sporulation lipoprotein [Cytobacillus sp. FJAT-54145]|uniref:YhcN/YlaJ family sporulation lipoprotein n=1 Tax=Cytobacillus spartinae TaxID=3299023 RepID=A0ABW6KGV1_9BACI
MNKKYLTIPIAAFMTTIGLVGCGTNEEATQDGNASQAQPIGYYSNENHQNGGNANIYNENDGPLTEIMDHSFGVEGQQARNRNSRILNMRDEDGNPGNPSKPLADYDKNWFEKDNRFSHGDANYHGHLDDNTRQPKSSYYTAYEGDLAIKIGDVVGSVQNVEDVRSVVYGSNVLIAVDLENEGKELETKNRIREAVQPYLHGRSVQVETDEGTFSRIRNIDNDLRDGGPREQITLDLNNLFR